MFAVMNRSGWYIIVLSCVTSIIPIFSLQNIRCVEFSQAPETQLQCETTYISNPSHSLSFLSTYVHNASSEPREKFNVCAAVTAFLQLTPAFLQLNFPNLPDHPTPHKSQPIHRIGLKDPHASAAFASAAFAFAAFAFAARILRRISSTEISFLTFLIALNHLGLARAGSRSHALSTFAALAVNVSKFSVGSTSPMKNPFSPASINSSLQTVSDCAKVSMMPFASKKASGGGRAHQKAAS